MNSDQQALFEGATSDLIDYAMRLEGLDMLKAMDVVYRSKLFSKLENPNTGLYREGPVYLYDMLCRERGKKLPVKKIYAANRRRAIVNVLMTLIVMSLAGCTSYSSCKDYEDRIVSRYDQNIIRDEDSSGYAFWKGVKHGFFDVITLATCEFWYANVRSSYYHTSFYGYFAADKDRSMGVKVLESFLGIKLGEKLPENSDNCFNRVPIANNPNAFFFKTKRSFSSYPYSYRVSVTPKEKKVWEICAFLSFYPDEKEMDRAKAVDRLGPDRSYISGRISENGFYSGAMTTYRPFDQQWALLTAKAKEASTEQKRLHSMLERKYGKKFHNGIMAFENKRYLIIPECDGLNALWIRIRAVDSAIEHEVSTMVKSKDEEIEKRNFDAF